jgi:UDP-N-acetylglucosamine--N-acetylmuramyl-(pentapeptide) pyrophosphoryl-undecaprenol N-acetylglucosamine transferase
MMSSQSPIMVMAGGTGGHVFPALAVASCLRERGQAVVWMGTRSGIEARLVPEAGFPIEWLKIQGLRGKGVMAKALAPFKLALACWQALSILRRHRPCAVLGMGGFVSGPGGLMAWAMRIPLIVHEQNAIIGLTNRLLSHLARVSYFAFPQAAQSVSRAQVVGNPVRAEIVAMSSPQQRFDQHPSNAVLRVLVVGGSLGARSLNQVVPKALALMDAQTRPRVMHQCGPKHLDECQANYRQHNIEAEVLAFIDDMKAAYEWADLVICRAGALTVAELAAAGVASILAPYPHAVDDHQFHNAGWLADAGAALRIRDDSLTPEWLVERLAHFANYREELLDMAVRARALAYTDAAARVADGLLNEART